MNRMNVEKLIKKTNLYAEKQAEYKVMDEKQLNEELLNIIHDIESTQDTIKTLEKDYERAKKLNKIILDNYEMIDPKYKFETLPEYWEIKTEQATEKYNDEESMSRNTIAGFKDYEKFLMGQMKEIEKLITKRKRNG